MRAEDASQLWTVYCVMYRCIMRYYLQEQSFFFYVKAPILEGISGHGLGQHQAYFIKLFIANRFYYYYFSNL